ncbi:hypothetical protein [Dactylosporangium salmoneum]
MHNRDLPDLANVSHRLPFLWWFVARPALRSETNHVTGVKPPAYSP